MNYLRTFGEIISIVAYLIGIAIYDSLKEAFSDKPKYIPKQLPPVEQIDYDSLIFIEEYGKHKILKHPTKEIFYIKKHKLRAHKQNRSKLVLNGNRKIRTFNSVSGARSWVGNRWNESPLY